MAVFFRRDGPIGRSGPGASFAEAEPGALDMSG